MSEQPTFNTDEDDDSKQFIMDAVKDVHWNVDRDDCIEESMKCFEDSSLNVNKEIEYSAGRHTYRVIKAIVPP